MFFRFQGGGSTRESKTPNTSFHSATARTASPVSERSSI
nr:MAG TPA: hypothetical protein [Caudoviricetes sp.]